MKYIRVAIISTVSTLIGVATLMLFDSPGASIGLAAGMAAGLASIWSKP